MTPEEFGEWMDSAVNALSKILISKAGVGFADAPDEDAISSELHYSEDETASGFAYALTLTLLYDRCSGEAENSLTGASIVIRNNARN